MDIINALIVFVFGLVLGLIAMGVYKNRNSDGLKAQLQLAERHNLMLLKLRDQLSSAQNALDQIENESIALKSQLSEIDFLLAAEETNDPTQKLTFYGEHATPFIRTAKSQKKSDSQPTEYQPKDFSGVKTGLFDGTDSAK